MSEFKGTPGPWISDNDSLVKRECSSKGYHFISTESGFYSDKKDSGFELSGCISLNDAKLIAAAPELLEALQACEKILSEIPLTVDLVEDLLFARSAIAKALGQ